MQDPANSDPDEVRRKFDWTTMSPSAAVIETVALAADRGVTDFGPLYEYVDPDALDAIIRSSESVLTDKDTVISFLFADYEVTVHGDGGVAVRPDAR